MNKKGLSVLCIIIAAICAVSVLVFTNDVRSEKGNGLQQALEKNGIDALYSDMQSGRSEIFPVIGHELGDTWKIATLFGEEVFFVSLANADLASDTFNASTRAIDDERTSGVLYLCGRDIVYYDGDNVDTKALLASISQATTG